MWKGNYLPSTVFLKKLGQVRLSFLKSHPASCFCPPSVREDSEAVRKRFLVHLQMTLETWVKPLKTWLWLYRMYYDKIPWRRERLPTPVFWPGEFHGLYSPGGRRVRPDYTLSLSLFCTLWHLWSQGLCILKKKYYSLCIIVPCIHKTFVDHSFSNYTSNLKLCFNIWFFGRNLAFTICQVFIFSA